MSTAEPPPPRTAQPAPLAPAEAPKPRSTETPSPSAPTPPPPAPGSVPHRPRGRIAKLPPSTRERINQMLDEGIPYADLIQQLGPEGQGIYEYTVTRWFQTGYQDWVKNQLWLEETRSRLDLAIDVITENDGSNVHQANLHIAATQLIENLIRKGDIMLEAHPQEYVSLVNSVTRLSREALSFQKYREACILARQELAKLKDPTRKFSEEETLAVVNRLDQILGFK